MRDGYKLDNLFYIYFSIFLFEWEYIVFFRGRDADTLNQAFMEYTRLEQKLDKKPSIRRRLAQALKKTLDRSQTQQKERSKSKGQDMSL